MAEWLVQQLTSLGATVEKRPIGTHTLEGKEVDLPPVVIGQVGNDPKKVRSTLYITANVLSVFIAINVYYYTLYCGRSTRSSFV